VSPRKRYSQSTHGRFPAPERMTTLLALAGAVGCGGNWEAGSARTPPEQGEGGMGNLPSLSPAPMGLHAVGSEIHDERGNSIILRGVNRSGSEYSCTKQAGVFDGPSDEASVRAIASWNLNAVRVPLNEACWLGFDGELSPVFTGADYRNQIIRYVELLQENGLIPILDLHWAGPGDSAARELWPMPNADHTEEFWRDVARTFLDNDGVIFEPYNEPYPDNNRASDAAWACWRDGCMATQWNSTESYRAVGMQALVDAIRDTGATQLILLGGVEYSNDLSQFLEHLPEDPLGNIGAAWHAYNFNSCVSPACWDNEPGSVRAQVPVVATEIGQSDCQGASFLKPLMTWLDENEIGYLAWSWNTGNAPCTPRTSNMENTPWFLISDYADPQPTSEYAATFRDHVAGL
jgi:endoglucanase